MYENLYSKSDAEEIISYSRDALEVYAKEGQKMDIGSVDDLLNMKAGIFLRIQSTGSFGRVRGRGSVYNSQSLASSLINSTVYAASKRSIGSEISRNEISSVKFSIAPIDKVKVTDDPLKNIEIGSDVPIIMSEDGEGWLYPTDAEEYNWSISEYLTKTCKKVNVNPNYWKNNKIVVATTRPITEKNPGGEIVTKSGTDDRLSR